MKLTLTELNLFIFCLFNVLTINTGVAQNAPIKNRIVQDSLKIKNKDEMLVTPFGTFNLSQTTGTVFRISGDQLRKTAGNNLSQALRGRVPGLRITKTSNTPGIADPYSYSLNGGSPYILIDGQPRGLQVDLREVEEVLVLNDATFNALLGALGDNGLIYVKTKGGSPGKHVVEVNYQRGINTPTRMAKSLSAAEYATVINKAATNDGLSNLYSQEAIDAYSNGSNPIKYPNVNSQETFLKDSAPSNFASLGVYGGKNDVGYGAFVGYSDWRGLENVGDPIKGRDLTFRTKIKARLNDFMVTHASVYGGFRENKRPVIESNTMFSWITGTPANSFPLKYNDLYIVNNQFSTNLLSELEKGGTRTDYTANMVFDLGLDFDLKKFVPGLTYSTYVMMRTYNAQSLVANNTPALYTLDFSQSTPGNEIITTKVDTNQILELDVTRASFDVVRNFIYGGNFNYSKNMGEGVLNMNLSHILYYIPVRDASSPDYRRVITNLNGSFSLKNKYICFANLDMSSSNKFINSNRTDFFPTLGVAWVASNEDFLKDSKTINSLKFKTSYGVVGTEYTAQSLYYLDTWTGGKNTSTIFLGTANTAQNKFGYNVAQTGNTGIDWVTYNQMFAGVELKMFKKLSLDINYFNIEIQGQVTQASELYATALGNDYYLPFLNFKNSTNKGFNSNITFNDNFGSFKYYVGANAGYNKIIGTKLAEIAYPDQYRLQQGQAQDNIMGYVSDGLYTAANIGSALPQFGNVKIGDIKYVDQNGDNVIDSRDQRAIGNSTPRINYGINVGVEYKGVNLDVVGMGVADYDLNLNNLAYYNQSGLGNYYGSINSNLPNGNANPRLSTMAVANNKVNSDYWLMDGSFFRISNLELGYTLPKSILSNGAFKDVKLFLRGSNLALFSKMKDLDPENVSAGVSQYPMMRSIVIGANLNF